MTDSSRGVLDRLWAVVPAGGAGTRLWPLSRARRPKFLLDLTDSGRTLLQGTVDRLQPLVGSRVVVVTGAVHERAVRRQLPGVERVLAEPSPRDSMAAIGWAAAVLEREQPDAIIGSFAADHVVLQDAEFRAAVTEAAEVAATGRLVTIGIEPTEPATAFGYVAAGERLDDFPTACAVREFVEKPDAARAASYVASGEYRWNAGMFLVGASRLLELLAAEHPELTEGLREIAADPGSIERRWPGLRRIAIDHAVAEPAAAAGQVAMVPGPFAWEDLGDFAALASLQGRGGGVRVLGDDGLVVTHDSNGLVVPGGGRTVTVVGLDDVVVVDTGDAVLVTSTTRAQDVKALVEELKRTGRGHLT